jgi:hypothetical protein
MQILLLESPSPSWLYLQLLCHRAMQNGERGTSRVRLYAALLSGAVASGANMALLGTASAAGITTAHGGLLHLFDSVSST